MCVLGMHRCGTSLTVRLLDLLGFDLGREEDRLEAAPDNPGGFWEQRPIMEVNDAIFEALGGTWWAPPEMPPGWEHRAELEPLRERAREVLAEQFGESTRWAWKDPRTSLTLPFWREIVPQAKYVVCLRNPADVLASLLRREPRTHTTDSANALWLRYVAKALEHTAGDERLVVFYEDYFSSPDWQLDRLARFAGAELSEGSQSVREELGGAIDADLRHHRTDAREVAAAAVVPVEARALYLTARAGHVAAAAHNGGGPGLPERAEPSLGEAIDELVPALRREGQERQSAAALRRELDEAITVAHAERDVARREERQARVALDRALEEIGMLNVEGIAGAGGGDLVALLGPEAAGGRADPALRRALAEISEERRARHNIEHSLSWRITAPLRMGKEVLAGPRERLRTLAGAGRRGGS